MKLIVALLLSVLCLALPAHAPEPQDKTAGDSQDATENLTSVAARQEALAAHLKSARELRQANDPLKAAQSLNQAGRLQLKLNLPDEALATFQESLALAEQSANALAKVDALNGLAATHIHSGKFDLALPLVQEAISIGEQNNYVRGRAEALLLLSDCENIKNHSQALKTANEALALWQSVGDNRWIVRSHLIIGNYHLAQNSLEDASLSYEIARSQSHENGLKDLEADALINLGFIEFRRGAWQNVTRFMWDAEKLFDAEADPYKLVQVTGAIAEAYIESGLAEAGLPKFYEALEYVKKTKSLLNETRITWATGRALYLSGKYPEALAMLEEALAGAESLKHPVIKAMCHDFLGRTYEAMNDHASALQHFQTALDLYSGADNPMEVARTRALIGQVYENSGRLQEARESYQQALLRFDAHSDRVNQSATLFALGRLEMKTGNYEAAENHLRRSIEVTDNIRRLSTSRDLTAAFSATVHDRYEQYIQCLMRNHRNPGSQSQVIRAFETSESARARSLAELLRVSDTNLLSNVDAELSRQERSLRQSLRMKEDERVALLTKKYEKSELEKLDSELERLNTEYKNVLASINQRYPAFGQLTQPQGWDLSRIQEDVIDDDDTLLLEFILGPEKSYLWAITRSSITSHELPSQTIIGDAVKKVYVLLRDKPKPETKNNLDQATKELAQMILSPVADQLQTRRIIVAADGALNYIPFQILPVAENAEPLVAQHEVINVPSASILGELRREAGRRGVREKVLAAFGNPVFSKQNEQVTATSRSFELTSDSFDPAKIGTLFYSGREIANLRDVASEEKTYAATQYDATRDHLLKTDLTRFAILHFATHGRLDPNRPENSGLLLSNTDREGQTLNGFVGLQDVYSLRAPVDLVVLSACETGLGKDIRGEGLIGLTRGFMYAGATSVVASLWKVEDETTAELMKRFYTEMLKNGKTPAEALRLAQNSIRQEPQWSSPHYWAGFTLQGEYRYVVNSSRGWATYQIVLLSVVVVILISVFGVFVWRKATRR
jgi:CHAT domain-containing protein